MNLRLLPLFLFACGPIAVEPGATDSTGVSSTTGTSTSTTDAASSSSTSPPVDLGEALTDLPPPERPADTDRDLRVFVTSSHHRGDMRVDFMSIEATTPDEVCDFLGRAVGDDLTFRAWVSMDDDAPAVSFTRTSGDYIRTDGVVIARGWDDLVDGTLLAPIAINEWGGFETTIGNRGVWTGTRPNGVRGTNHQPSTHGVEFTPNCSEWLVADWSAAFGSAIIGFQDVTDSRWSEVFQDPDDDSDNGQDNCVSFYHLYCFEQ